MTKRTLWLLGVLCFATAGPASAQSIKGHYVSRAQEDGTIYHTLPCTLFESAAAGDLSFDITYKEKRDGRATVNFTYFGTAVAAADSVRFTAGRVVIAAPATKIYIEPAKKEWKHRFTFSADVRLIGSFFDEQAVPEVVVYAGGEAYVYRVKRAAWKSYAPIGYKIFEMIRLNEQK